MSSSIGNELNALGDSIVQRALYGSTGKGAAGVSGTTPFAEQLMKHFDADRDGKLNASELQSALTAPGSDDLAGRMLANAGTDSVDTLWKRAQQQSIADGFGPGDAMSKQLYDRYSSNRDGGSDSTSSGFDFGDIFAA